MNRFVSVAVILCFALASIGADQTERRLPHSPTTTKRTRPSRAKDVWRIPPRDIPPIVRLMSYDSEVARRLISYVIYLPPQYQTERERRFPVIYMLPGMNGDCREVAPMVQKLDEAIRAKEIPPMIAVGVQGIFGSMYTDSADGARPVESTIVNELIDRVDGTFRTIADREHRGIEGFDMGGYGAAHLAFKYPEKFGAVSIISAPLGPLAAFQEEMPAIATDVWQDDEKFFAENDPWVLVEKNAEKIRGRMKIRLYCGSAERYGIYVEDFHRRLLALGIDHEYVMVPKAKHNFGMVLQGVADRVFPFWVEAFAPVPGTQPATGPTTGATTAPSGESSKESGQ